MAAAFRDVEAATLARDGPPPITRTTFPTCRAHYPGGSNGCTYRLLPLMQEVSSLGIRVQAAGFILLNPNPDQLAREIVPLGEPIKGLPSNVLLHHLPLKLDAVRTLLSGHGFHLSKAQNT